MRMEEGKLNLNPSQLSQLRTICALCKHLAEQMVQPSVHMRHNLTCRQLEQLAISSKVNRLSHALFFYIYTFLTWHILKGFHLAKVFIIYQQLQKIKTSLQRFPTSSQYKYNKEWNFCNNYGLITTPCHVYLKELTSNTCCTVRSTELLGTHA